jgi:hypothetical protein
LIFAYWSVAAIATKSAYRASFGDFVAEQQSAAAKTASDRQVWEAGRAGEEMGRAEANGRPMSSADVTAMEARIHKEPGPPSDAKVMAAYESQHPDGSPKTAAAAGARAATETLQSFAITFAVVSGAGLLLWWMVRGFVPRRLTSG